MTKLGNATVTAFILCTVGSKGTRLRDTVLLFCICFEHDQLNSLSENFHFWRMSMNFSMS